MQHFYYFKQLCNNVTPKSYITSYNKLRNRLFKTITAEEKGS